MNQTMELARFVIVGDNADELKRCLQWLNIITIFFLALTLGCNKTKNIISLESEWKILTNTKNCLNGGQYCKNKRCGGEGCCLNESEKWRTFLNVNGDSLAIFLIKKIHSLDTTQIHNCPHFNALEGELAVYCLQHIFKTNWFQLNDGFRIFYEKNSHPIDYQVLRSVIKDSVLVDSLKNEWKKITLDIK